MYTGEMVDANALVYLRARYYHPGVGVFTSLDPVEGVNRYQYVASNPVNWADPSGLQEAPLKELCSVRNDPFEEYLCTLCGGIEDPAEQALCVATASQASVAAGEEIAPILLAALSNPWTWLGLIAIGFAYVCTRGDVLFESCSVYVPYDFEGMWNKTPPRENTQVPAATAAPGTQAQTAVANGSTCAPPVPEPNQNRTPNVIVELGAGDYSNAILMKERYPNAIVWATNRRSDWDTGKTLYDAGFSPDDYYHVAYYTGWISAKESGLQVGENGPIENIQVPPALGDLVYSILPEPLPSNAFDFGAKAAVIANANPGTVVAVTEGGSESSLHFVSGFLSLRSHSDFHRIDGSPYGIPGGKTGITWGEGPNYFTRQHIVGG